MSEVFRSSIHVNKPYVPGTLSEIYDMLASFYGGAPTFRDKSGYFPERNIDSEFLSLTEGFGKVRKQLGEERYAALIDLAARAKALFAEDQDDTNGKTDQGYKLLFEIENIVQEARRKRVAAKLKDKDGEVTGD